MWVFRIFLITVVTCAGFGTVFSAPLETPFSLGILKGSDNGRFLIHEDGAPFFYLGDTAWELFHRLNREEAIRYMDDRAKKGFTVIQAVALGEDHGLTQPNAYGHLPFKDPKDPRTPDRKEGEDNDYWDHVEWMIDEAAHRGLYIGLLPTWGAYVTSHWAEGVVDGIFNEANAEEYGRFIGALFNDKQNLIWILGGDRAASTEKSRTIWRAMAKGIAVGVSGKEDYSKVLMTYHTSGPGFSSDFFHEDAWLDFNGIQSSHGDAILNYKMIQHDYALYPPKPTLDLESTYPEVVIQKNQRPGTDDDARRVAYWGVFSGACGHTYGHNAIWQMQAPNRKPRIPSKSYWYEALDAPSATQMGYLKNLMLSRPFVTLVPDQEMIHSGQGEGIDHIACLRGENCAMVYFPTGKPVTLHFGRINSKRIKAQWFDPRTAKFQEIGEFENRGIRAFTPPGDRTARGNDWVLVLDGLP